MDFALRSCGLRGHATFAPDEPELARRLRADTPEGEAWRCLRCECFVLGPAKGSGPATTAPEVPRGRALRDRFIMRFLAVERFVRGAIVVLLALGVLHVRHHKESLQQKLTDEWPIVQPLADQLGWQPEKSKLLHLVESGLAQSERVLLWLAIAMLAYAVIEFVEAVGLWLGHRWGEYFAVVATAAFLPLEIYELTEKITVLRLAALAINIAALVWLVWSKRLFGVRGGAAAYHADHAQESLLTVQRASR